MLRKIKDEIKEQVYWLGRIYKYPKMVIEKIDYDKYWETKRGTEHVGKLLFVQKSRAEVVAKILKDEKDISVLDIGGGEGNILNYIKKEKNISIKEMYNADISDFILAQSEKFGIKSIKCDITDIKSVELFPETDWALMLEILEHIPNSEEFLLEVMEKVKKGAIFSIPNTGFYVYRLRLLFGKTPMQWRRHPAEHLRFWTVRDIRFWLDSLGFAGKYKIHLYVGVPLLNKLFPALFGAGMVVRILK